MMGYLKQPEETAKTLQTHADGRVWLHTGDIGTMDPDGFFYFRLREKRMIKSSGMNVYPAQVERVKAFVVLNDQKKAGPEMGHELIDFCRKDLIKWSCPREIEFRAELPLTLVGKVAFAELAAEEMEKMGDAADVCRE